MERPLGPRQPVPQRRARSLDRSQSPKKDAELRDGQCLSLPATPSGQAQPPGGASEGSGQPRGPGSCEAEAPGATGTAHGPEGTGDIVAGEQRPPRDTRKDKAQARAQQGLLKTVINFFLRPGPEETRERAGRRAKGKEGLPPPAESPESPGEPVPRKRAHDRKASRRKHGHRKHAEEETRGARGREAEGREAALPEVTAAPLSKEAGLVPAPGDREDSDLHQSVLIEGRDAGVSQPSSQATGRWQEEELKKLDQDTIIRMIVQLLRDVGDRWEEELQASQPEVAPQNPAPAVRKKSQERKPNLKRTFSHKKHGSEEPKRAGAAGAAGPGSRLPKRPSFLYLCVGGLRSSISSSLGSEEPEVQEALSTDRGGPSPSELSSQVGSWRPGADSQPGRDAECREFMQKIIALLQDEKEGEGVKQLQVQESEAAVETPAPPCRKKSQEKKSSLRKAFSYKKHGYREPKRAGAAGASGPESRPPKRPSYLPLCVGGLRPPSSHSLDLQGPELPESSPAEGDRVGPSEAPSQARRRKPDGRSPPARVCDSKELIIQKLVALLQEVDGHLGEQIRRHPSFKRFFYQLPDSSLLKLAATLRRQGARSPEPGRNPAEMPYQFAFDLANKRPGHNHAVLSLMGLRYPQFPRREAPQNITSPEAQSPD